MHDLQDPRKLSLGQVFRQAQQLSRQTSRGSNPDWYRSALELDRQWHILIDGHSAPGSWVHDRRSGTWVEGPEIGEDLLGEDDRGDPERKRREIEGLLLRILSDGRLGDHPRSLGVVIHVSNEMAIADLSAEYSSDNDFHRVRAALEEGPCGVLADSTLNVEGIAAKILPQWGLRHGERRSVAILVSRRLDGFLRRVTAFGEERNIPVIPHLISAPLTALMMLPLFLEGNSGEGDIVLLHYPRLTVLVVLDAAGELVLVRGLPHRHLAAYPVDIGEVVGNAAASMNLKAPKVHVLPIGEVDPEGLVEELMAEGARSENLGIGLVEATPGHMGMAPGARPELMLGSLNVIQATLEQSVLFKTQSFQELAHGWATQNFDLGANDRRMLFPSRGELVLLKLIDKAKITLATLALCVSLIATYEGAGISRRSTRDTNHATLESMRSDLVRLTAEDKHISYWESMMQPRSEAWAALELLLRMIPADGAILLTSCEYKASGEPPRTRNNKRIAFQREWVLKGYCRSNARAALTQLSSNRHVIEIFDAMAAEYSREAFRANEKSRSLAVTMQQHQGEYPSNGILASNAAKLYNTCFDIKVAQTFGDKDPLAIPVAAPRSTEQGKGEP